VPRERLPDRRQNETVDLWHGGQRYHLTIGEYPDGRPGECRRPTSNARVRLMRDLGGGRYLPPSADHARR